jgi:hypothetical protein
VARFSEPDADADLLVEVISAAVDARRPMLAARLVGLLSDHVEIEPGSPVERAQRAARLLLKRSPTAADNSWSELEEAWAIARRLRMGRIRRRMRQSLHGKSERIPRVTRRKKR